MIDIQLHDASNLEIGFNQIPAQLLIPMFLPLHEFPANDSRVLVGFLINLNGIITAEEIYDEFPIVVVFDLGNESSFEPQYVLVLGEHLDDVFLWGFGLQGIHATQTVL